MNQDLSVQAVTTQATDPSDPNSTVVIKEFLYRPHDVKVSLSQLFHQDGTTCFVVTSQEAASRPIDHPDRKATSMLFGPSRAGYLAANKCLGHLIGQML